MTSTTAGPAAPGPIATDAFLAVADGASALATREPDALARQLDRAVAALREGAARRGGPLPALAPTAMRAHVRDALGHETLPEQGVGAGSALRMLCELAGWGAADAGDPRCVGHLHTPTLAVAVAADMVASALNQSLDSWDQAPAMTWLEQEVLDALGALVYGPGEPAGGVVTTGGTESNLMGLLLARSQACRSRLDVDVVRQGLPAQAAGFRVYCSEAAHFSTQRMLAVLGLGEECLVTVPVDDAQRMRPDALRRLLVAEPHTWPLAVVATAGTTDSGAVDPLPRLAALARERGCWFHVDAAYGGGALFSTRLRSLLDGLSQADSVSLDLHKLGWQPTAAGVFLARGRGALAPLDRQVAYLNPADDEDAGYTSLLGRSLRTTRRPDVLKIAVTLRALGRSGLGAMVDRCHDLAHHAAACVDADPMLVRAFPVSLSTLVFRYRGTDSTDETLDVVNARIRRRLLREGRAVVGRCEVDGRVWLKLTLLNPYADPSALTDLVEVVASAGRLIEAELA